MFGPEIDAALISSVISLLGAFLSHIYNKRSSARQRIDVSITKIEELAVRHWLTSFPDDTSVRASCAHLQTGLLMLSSIARPSLESILCTQKKRDAFEKKLAAFRQAVTYDFENMAVVGVTHENPKITQIKDAAHGIRRLFH